MSKHEQQEPRKPATKFPQIRKKMAQQKSRQAKIHRKK